MENPFALVNWTVVAAFAFAIVAPLFYVTLRPSIGWFTAAFFIVEVAIVAGVSLAALQIASGAMVQTGSQTTFWAVLTNPDLLSWWDFMLGSQFWSQALGIAIGIIFFVAFTLTLSLVIASISNQRALLAAILAVLFFVVAPLTKDQVIPVGSYTIYSGSGDPIPVYSEESMYGSVAEGTGMLIPSGMQIQVGVGEVVAPGGIYIRVIGPAEFRGYIWYQYGGDLLIAPK